MGSKRDLLKGELSNLFEPFLQTGDPTALRAHILSKSNLPGPRANLELAQAFGDVAADYLLRDRSRVWSLCVELSEISAEQASVNDSEEFLPFCGAIGLGSVGSTLTEFYEQALILLRGLANDARWRMREAVCMGLQRLLTQRGRDTLHELESWIGDGSLLELRAVAAAVAEPALLKNEEMADSALRMHQKIFDRMLASEERKSEEFRALRKGLGYTLSVVVCAVPQTGFELIRWLIDTQDRDVMRIVKQNLKKNRLTRRFPQEVEATTRLLN